MDCNVISCILGKNLSFRFYFTLSMGHYIWVCCALLDPQYVPTYIHVVVHLFLFNLSLSIACTIDHFISHLLSATGAIYALVHCFSSGYSFRCVLFFIVFVLRFYSQRIDNEFGASSAKGSVKFHTKPFKADSRFLCCCCCCLVQCNVMEMNWKGKNNTQALLLTLPSGVIIKVKYIYRVLTVQVEPWLIFLDPNHTQEI